MVTVMRKIAAFLAGCVACAIVAAFAAQSSAASTGSAAIGAAEIALGFEITAPPRPRGDIAFGDAGGAPLTIADKRGKVVLLNLWATWCPPCVREMPSLDHLQARLGGAGFEVVAVSVDRAGAQVVDPFYARMGLEHLAKYFDPTSRISRALGVIGLPTTVLIDRDGNEVGRVAGAADWDSAAALALIRHYMDGAPSTSTAAE